LEGFPCAQRECLGAQNHFGWKLHYEPPIPIYRPLDYASWGAPWRGCGRFHPVEAYGKWALLGKVRLRGAIPWLHLFHHARDGVCGRFGLLLKQSFLLGS
jgi:hypothetical protein